MAIVYPAVQASLGQGAGRPQSIAPALAAQRHFAMWFLNVGRITVYLKHPPNRKPERAPRIIKQQVGK